MNDFKGKKIAVLGLGVEGLSSALYLKAKGASVTVLDEKEKKEFSQETIEQLNNEAIDIVAGKDYLSNLNNLDMVVRSPGIRLDLPEIIKASEKGIEITSQIKLFFDLCPCPIIGVTGTKGKGTTSSLIYEMLKKQVIDVYLGGNIGKPPFEFLDKLTPQSKVVLELSSFQLQDITRSPHIGVVLMITSEHLQGFGSQNYHKDVYEYVDSKRKIIRFQQSEDVAIINQDYIASRESDIETSGKIFNISSVDSLAQGAYVKDKAVYLRFEKKEQKIIDSKDILLPGQHNLENVCAAVMASALSGVSVSNMVSVLKTFKGLEHRLQFISEINGVKYYDDSFSTTPETAIAAIQAFTQPEILILGGSSKGSDFSELGNVIWNAKNIKAIIGVGVEWPEIKSKIKNQKSKIIEGCKNMKEIVKAAFDMAEDGDVVLLSPACASFGMFKNYKDRGEQFKKEVLSL